MEEKSKQPGLSWSTPLTPHSETASPAAKDAAGPLAPAGLSAFGDKKVLQTQAPIYTGLLVGGIIIGVLLSTTWDAVRRAPALSTAATSTPQQETTTASVAVATQTSTTEAPLVVNDQKAGSSVLISKLNIARPTWVVVYVSREGKPGNALGARLFFAGDKRGTVGLLRNTTKGQSYFVGLSVDNGDRVFSLTADKPLADADGGPLWATFQAR